MRAPWRRAWLNAEFTALLQLPKVKDLLGKAGMEAAHSTPAALQAVVAQDYPRWGVVIQRNGISAE